MPWPELLLLTIVIYFYRFISRQIDQRLFSKHGREVMRLSGSSTSKNDEHSYWLRFWVQQSTKQLGDPVLDRLVILGLLSLAGVVFAVVLLFSVSQK